MNRRTQSGMIFFIALSLFIPGCGPASQAPLTAADQDPGPSAPAAESATGVPTATVYPPVFKPDAIGDSRVLDSYILIRTDKTTGCGGFDEKDSTETIGYIKEPFGAYEVKEFLVVDDEYATHRKYLVGGRFYETNGSVDWLILLETPPDESEILQHKADMREGYIGGSDLAPISAQFVGQEDFQGIPANHFTVDETNFQGGSDPTSTYKLETAQGDLYLAQGANYVLEYHVKVTGNVCSRGGEPGYFPGVREIMEGLTSINQLTEIAIPPEYLEPEQTLLDFGLPVPAGSTLTGMRRYAEIHVDNYFFAASVSADEFLEFYENLSPTSGWTVSHVGQVTYHFSCSDPDQVCIIINKGDVQFILDYGEGGFVADYDWDHSYSPQ